MEPRLYLVPIALR